jgi:hypothetical protein
MVLALRVIDRGLGDVTGQTAMRHRHFPALSLLVGITLVATSALWNPYLTAVSDLADARADVLVTGIAAASTAAGTRSDSRVGGSRQKVVVTVGHGTGPLPVLPPPLRALRLLQPDHRPAHDEATLRHRDRAPPQTR